MEIFEEENEGFKLRVYFYTFQSHFIQNVAI